jgi:stalled ribosome rescue protein Dom34
MKTKKQVGVWMDNSGAHVVKGGYEQEMVSKHILSGFTHQQREHYLNRNENLMHNKEQQEQANYYKKIGDALKDSDEILIFGPTTAKDELANLIKKDAQFKTAKIEILPSDKMTGSQCERFVKKHFNWM